MTKIEVVVIGNIGLDTCVYGFEDQAGKESNFTRNLDMVGQAGGYSARGFARFGLKTAFIGHVGADHAGNQVRDTLIKEGIDIRGLGIDPAGTARSVNLMRGDGRRTGYYDGRGHMTLEPDLDLCRQILRGARLAHFHLPNWARKLLPLARAEGLTISCDLQDIPAPTDPYRQDFIQQADLLFFSAANHSNPLEIIDYCFQRGPARLIIVGMGSEGCALATREVVSFYGPLPFSLPVIDTNGAGDALAVGFLSALLFAGQTPETALLQGQKAARLQCSRTADVAAMPDQRELAQIPGEMLLKARKFKGETGWR